jgi:hypothetical protein
MNLNLKVAGGPLFTQRVSVPGFLLSISSSVIPLKIRGIKGVMIHVLSSPLLSGCPTILAGCKNLSCQHTSRGKKNKG